MARGQMQREAMWAPLLLLLLREALAAEANRKALLESLNSPDGVMGYMLSLVHTYRHELPASEL